MVKMQRAEFARDAIRCLILAALCAQSAEAQRSAPVELAYAERRTIVEALKLTGTLTSPKTSRLSSEVQGRVVDIKVDVGDRVQAGDTLLRLDDELARLDLAQAVAAEQESEAALADAERRLREARELLDKRVFPESETRSLAAQAERDRAVHKRRAAERARAAALVERHALKAPFAGVIAARNTDLGERVDPDSMVLQLVAVDRLQLDLQVPQRYFQRVGPNTPVSVQVDALPDDTFRTSVARVVPVSDVNARTFLVRAYLDNPTVRMTPGMSVRGVLHIGTGRDGIVVPRDALIRYPDGRVIVWVVDGQGAQRTVVERLVNTGLAFDGLVEIKDGLSVGEPVVVRGNESLQQGQTVRIADAN
jgi:RND family efflux transporter MFP subunit